MKRKLIAISLMLAVLIGTMSFPVFAVAYNPPTSYGAPENPGVVFYYYEESGRWGFEIGLNASAEIRKLAEEFADGRFEEAGFDSLHIDLVGDYKLNNGAWRSELPGYDEWVYVVDSQVNAETGSWSSSYPFSDYDGIFENETIPGGKSYFDNHTITFRVRYTVDFYHSENGESYEYLSPWSSEVTYSNNQKVEDPAALINHAPNLLAVELKKYEDGAPYLDFKADKTHSDVQLLNSISEQRVFTNVWVRVNGGAWVDCGEYLWMKEQFAVDAKYFFNDDNFDAAVYEAKFRYSFDYMYYPAAGKSGYIYSPFSNTLSKGMPSYEGASSWAKTELDKASKYGLITDRIKSNMAGKITREEFAEIAVKLYETYTGNAATPGNASFIDTKNQEILKAANLGLVTGVGNEKYAPNDLVTRQQMATILLRALKVINPDADFSASDIAKFADDNQVFSWGRAGVYYCFKTGIVTGIGSNKFDPEGKATREQGVIVCTRAYEYFKK